MCNHSEYGQCGSAVPDILEITDIFSCDNADSRNKLTL